MKCGTLAVAVLGFLLTVAHAQSWLEVKAPHYSIFYKAGYEKDAEFARQWMDRAEQLMKSKYNVTPEHYRASLYLYSDPVPTANIGTAQNRCCPVENGLRQATIDMLAPSAPAWKEKEYKSSLGMSKSEESYHAKILMSEYIPIGHYAIQDSRPDGGWRYYSAPGWFVQGLQEYDAIFHTTDTNRDVTSKNLLEWAKRNSDGFTCCSPGLAIKDVYNGGATFMTFLAVEFGEDIHARLLRSEASSFQTALTNETKPYTPDQLYQRFQAWLSKSADRS